MQAMAQAQVIRNQCIQHFGTEKGGKIYALGLQIPDSERDEWFDRLIMAAEQKSSEPFKYFTHYKFRPVPIKEFIESPYYLDKSGTVLRTLIEPDPAFIFDIGILSDHCS